MGGLEERSGRNGDVWYHAETSVLDWSLYKYKLALDMATTTILNERYVAIIQRNRNFHMIPPQHPHNNNNNNDNCIITPK